MGVKGIKKSVSFTRVDNYLFENKKNILSCVLKLHFENENINFIAIRILRKRTYWWPFLFSSTKEIENRFSMFDTRRRIITLVRLARQRQTAKTNSGFIPLSYNS